MFVAKRIRGRLGLVRGLILDTRGSRLQLLLLMCVCALCKAMDSAQDNTAGQ